MHHLYHYLGMFSFWSIVGIAAGCGVMALVESRKRAIARCEHGSVVDPFTRNETRALVLRYRVGVGDE